MKFYEKTLNKKYFFKGRVINTRVDDILLPNGKPANREVVEHTGGVTVVALTDEMEVLLVKQFRYPHHKALLEIPAGKLELSEDHRDAGIRELREETGAVADDFSYLGEIYPSPGYCEEIIYLYLARELHFFEQNLDEDEFLSVEKVPIETALKMVMENEIKDAKTQVGIMKVYNMILKEK